MESLPEDIIWYHFIKHLTEYDFIFVSKYIYNCFWNKIKQNKLIIDRYERIKEAYEELKTHPFVVKFDRICTLPTGWSKVIQVKILYNVAISIGREKIDIKIRLRGATGQPDFILIFSLGNICGSVGYYYLYLRLSEHGNTFVIESSYKNHIFVDHNGGVGYSTSEKDHWIPSINRHSFVNCGSLLQWCLSDIL